MKVRQNRSNDAVDKFGMQGFVILRPIPKHLSSGATTTTRRTKTNTWLGCLPPVIKIALIRLRCASKSGRKHAIFHFWRNLGVFWPKLGKFWPNFGIFRARPEVRRFYKKPSNSSFFFFLFLTFRVRF